ncbi:MAG: phosphatidate cytidylyltransferase [Gammaproteobacteria bacterium]|nr:phosphatidate cytidylyltransferase [Gammaproteobacteria bacterium]
MYIRILTAVPLILLVLLAIFYTSPTWFALISALIFLYGALEWGKLLGFSKKQQLLYLLLTVIAFFLSGFINALFLLAPSAIIWLFIPGLLFRFQQHPQAHWQHPYLHAAVGSFFLLTAWLGLNLLRLGALGPFFVLINLVVVWASDSCAYFVGRRWGKHPLAPGISPKKTIEGLVGALLASLSVGIVSGFLLKLSPTMLLALSFLSLLTGGICVVGDLYESMIKRIYKVKDSGTLLPGHGGLLDRIDGLLAATPFFTLGIIWLTLL